MKWGSCYRKWDAIYKKPESDQFSLLKKCHFAKKVEAVLGSLWSFISGWVQHCGINTSKLDSSVFCALLSVWLAAVSHLYRTYTPPGNWGEQGWSQLTLLTLDTDFLTCSSQAGGSGTFGPEPFTIKTVSSPQLLQSWTTTLRLFTLSVTWPWDFCTDQNLHSYIY